MDRVATVNDYILALNKRIEEYEGLLPPTGTTAESAIDGISAAYRRLIATSEGSHPSYGISLLNDHLVFREDLIKLVRKFGMPDEQVLGIYFPYRHKRNLEKVNDGLVIVLTKGFAVKHGGKQYRIDSRDSHSRTSVGEISQYGYCPYGLPLVGFQEGRSLTLTASVNVGLSSGIEISGFHLIRRELPPLFASLVLQDFKSKNIQTLNESNTGHKSVVSRPAMRLLRTWKDAELAAKEWMEFWGLKNVSLTTRGADGGIDVISDSAVAQVKTESSPIGRPKIQQLHGVAVAQGKIALYFSLAGYTADAIIYANENGIRLFSFDLQGEPEPANLLARQFQIQEPFEVN